MLGGWRLCWFYTHLNKKILTAVSQQVLINLSSERLLFFFLHRDTLKALQLSWHTYLLINYPQEEEIFVAPCREIIYAKKYVFKMLDTWKLSDSNILVRFRRGVGQQE